MSYLARRLIMKNRTGYRSAVLANAPLFYLPLDETSGTVAQDLTGNGNTGTYVGTVAYRTGQLFSNSSSYVELPGTNANCVALPAAVSQIFSPITAPHTIECWLKIPGSASNVPLIVGMAGGNSQNSVMAGSSGVAAGTPFHYVYCTDGTSANTVSNVNGKAAVTGGTPPNLASATMFFIDGGGTGTLYSPPPGLVPLFVGEFAIYTRPLTAGQVAQHFLAAIG